MPLIPEGLVDAYSPGVHSVFADGDAADPTEIDSEDITTLALATALACNITLNGVSLYVEPEGFDRWWLSGTKVRSAPLVDVHADD